MHVNEFSAAENETGGRFQEMSSAFGNLRELNARIQGFSHSAVPPCRTPMDTFHDYVKVQKELRSNSASLTYADKAFYESMLDHLRAEKDLLIGARRRDGDSNDGR